MKTRVVHHREPHDIYIGRPTKWGNPFEIGIEGTRDEVIAKYEVWIRNNANLMDSLHELEGKVLGCWCKPKNCHGDILVKLLNEKQLTKFLDF